MKKTPKLIVKREVGASIIKTPALFSPNAETFYVILGPIIQAYSVNTGKSIFEFERLIGEDELVGVQLHPVNPNAIVACDEIGNLIQWNLQSRLPEKTTSLQYSKEKTVVTEFYIIPAVGKKHDGGSFSVCIVYKFEDGKKKISICSDEGTLLHTLKFQLHNQMHCVALGGKLGIPYLAAISEDVLEVFDTTNFRKIRRGFLHGRTFTCIACHPQSMCIATGDNNGRVLVWYPGQDEYGLLYTRYHWHAICCYAVAFSDTGSHFFSAGREGTLVKWTTNSRGDKDFVHRISSGICHLSVAPENKYLAVSTLDNGIKIMDSQMKIFNEVQYFTWSMENEEALRFHAGIAFDPRSKSLVMNGKIGHIQFYSSRTSELKYNLDITKMNYMPPEPTFVPVNTDVVKIALNIDGQWMATVEQRDDGESHMEVRLKFWHFDSVKQIFCLNTSVELPHNGSVNALAFQPIQDSLRQLAVTTGSDFKFHTWTLVESTNTFEKGNLIWRCESTGYYRNLPVGDASFSVDGSLLAVAFGPTLTVWIPETNQLKCSLTPARSDEHIKQVEFGRADYSHVVVTSTKQHVCIWNLLTLKVMWTLSLDVSILSADPCSEFMAVFTRERRLVIFSPGSSKPVYEHKTISSSDILCAAFIPHEGPEKTHNVPWLKYSQLHFIDSKQQLLVLTEVEDKSEKEGLVLPESTLQSITPLSSMLARQKISEVEKLRIDMDQQLGVPGTEAIKELINVPAHTMPSLYLLCGPFLRSVVATNKKNAEEQESITGDKIQMEAEETFVTNTMYKSKPSSEPTNIADLQFTLENILNEEMDWVKSLLDIKS